MKPTQNKTFDIDMAFYWIENSNVVVQNITWNNRNSPTECGRIDFPFEDNIMLNYYRLL